MTWGQGQPGSSCSLVAGPVGCLGTGRPAAGEDSVELLPCLYPVLGARAGVGKPLSEPL